MTALPLNQYFALILLLFVLATSVFAETNQSTKVNLDLDIQIDPGTRSLKGRSIITVTNSTELRVILSKRFKVTQALIAGKPLALSSDSTGMPYYSWRIPFSLENTYQIEIHWHGELSPLNTSLDHRQTLNTPEPVSSAAGTYLPKSSGWYPHIIGALFSYNVSLTLPTGQRGLVAGKLIEESESAQGYRARFEFPYPSEGIDLMAGPYQITTDHVTDKNGKKIQLRTYFHPQLDGFADDYLDAVKNYLTFYEAWIGDYPFTEFSVVSSPTPTGFGMPTLTYLGINVLKLPFIRATSLGHEVLHNWWGNGVYPDYDKGNWSEGLTTFMADYTYKEQEGLNKAREMRLGWLRDFAALSPGEDEPLNTFTSRTHGASKIVGYNKTAMLFLMLRDQLGEDIFNRSIQSVWNARHFKVTSWKDLQRIFEAISGQNLELFFNQWLTRTGAPSIRIVSASKATTESSFQVTIVLEQSTPAYQLRLPIVIRTAAGEQTKIIDLQHERQTITLAVQNKPLEVTLDPDLRIFRLLASDTVPPILREVMVNQTTTTILLPKQEQTVRTAKTLARKLQHRALKITPVASALPTNPILVVGLQQQVDTWLAAHHLPGRPEITTKKSSAQAWTFRRSNGATLAIVSAKDNDSLQALLRPLPHYGRQSYIAFEGSKAIERGTWPVKMPAITIE